MPRCNEGYISSDIDKLMKQYDFKSILEVCLHYRMLKTGATDSNFDFPNERVDCLNIINFYIQNWQHSLDPWDLGVFNLLLQTRRLAI